MGITYFGYVFLHVCILVVDIKCEWVNMSSACLAYNVTWSNLHSNIHIGMIVGSKEGSSALYGHDFFFTLIDVKGCTPTLNILMGSHLKNLYK